MATILRKHRNVVGNRKESYVKFTSTGTTDTIHTGLHWVDYADYVPINAPIATADPNADLFINSASASVTEDDPGQVFINAIEDGATYILRAIGK